jgi:hypothetical protein
MLLPAGYLHHFLNVRPPGRLSNVSTRSCLVTRSSCCLSACSSIFEVATRVSCDSGERGGLRGRLTRSTPGSLAFGDIFAASIFAAFDPADRSDFLGLAARDGALRCDGAFGLARPFLAAALSRFGVYSTERVGMVWAPLVRAPKLTLARPEAPHIAGEP